eukprot:SAG11_NODE_102_length_16709_cov_31.066093_23_plen_47_part_00
MQFKGRSNESIVDFLRTYESTFPWVAKEWRAQHVTTALATDVRNNC